MSRFIHQFSDWPQFSWDSAVLLPMLGRVRNMQGGLIAKMAGLGFDLRQEAVLDTLTLDVIKSTEIEGEFLQTDQVRSSLARQLGMDVGGLVPSDRDVDGVVEMIIDATRAYAAPLTIERLFGWQAALFPSGRSGMYTIAVGQWRKDEKGPMQVVSGSLGNEKIHFQAPDAAKLSEEMALFLAWFNDTQALDPVIKAGIAHLWFITIHPFDDGNGRIARAITDLQLARAELTAQRFYSMSAQIRLQRKAYYDVLEKTQRGNLDITEWLCWFLSCLESGLLATQSTLKKVLDKAQFWETYATTILNKRQILLLNKLLDTFEGNLTSDKWAKIAKCSQDSAQRDIQDLLAKGILEKLPSGGRSTAYILKMPPDMEG